MATEATTTTSKFTISSSSSSSSISPESQSTTSQISNQQPNSELQPSSTQVSMLNKSVEWLAHLRELNYFPYNSCNSLTVYSYKYWTNQNRLIFATKENNLKEAYFQTLKAEHDDNNDMNDSNKLDSYLMPVLKVHKLPKVKSTHYRKRHFYILMCY
jgi:hypothetical protein